MADDVAAETFLIAFDRRERYDLSRADARPWLYGIASNLISRHRRAEVRQYRALARTYVTDIAENHADDVQPGSPRIRPVTRSAGPRSRARTGAGTPTV